MMGSRKHHFSAMSLQKAPKREHDEQKPVPAGLAFALAA